MTTFEICDDIFSKINIIELKKELCPKAHEPKFSFQILILYTDSLGGNLLALLALLAFL